MTDHNLNDDFDFPEDDDEVALPENFITIRTTSGESRYIETTEATSVINLLGMSDLRINGSVEAWYEGTQVQMDTVIPVHGTVTLIGSVKGGA